MIHVQNVRSNVQAVGLPFSAWLHQRCSFGKAGIADKAFFALADNGCDGCGDDTLVQQNSGQVGQIYTKYRGLMFYTAKGVLQDSYLAEDAVHETFLDIIRIIDSIRANNEKELSQFLRVLTHHKAVDMVRKCTRQKKSDTEIEDLDLSKSDVNVETIVLDKIDYENMLLLVQSMDEKYKTPLLLKVQGYKVSEIADFLNISPGNVKVRLHRARKIILTGLEENGNE